MLCTFDMFCCMECVCVFFHDSVPPTARTAKQIDIADPFNSGVLVDA